MVAIITELFEFMANEKSNETFPFSHEDHVCFSLSLFECL